MTNHMKTINVNLMKSMKIQFRHHFSFKIHIKLFNNQIKQIVTKFNSRYLLNPKYLPIKIVKITNTIMNRKIKTKTNNKLQ